MIEGSLSHVSSQHTQRSICHSLQALFVRDRFADSVHPLHRIDQVQGQRLCGLSAVYLFIPDTASDRIEEYMIEVVHTFLGDLFHISIVRYHLQCGIGYQAAFALGVRADIADGLVEVAFE